MPLKSVESWDLIRQIWPVCPYCGCKHSDPEDIFDSTNMEDGVGTDCPKCGNEYIVERVVDVSYTTEKIKEKE